MSSISAVPRRPVILIIMDGFGVNPSKQNNAVYEAPTPSLDRYFSRYSHTLLNASGAAVGLPDGQMGNSEVGHLTLGAGEIIRQDMVRISDSIASGEFYENTELKRVLQKARSASRPLHLIGLVSEGGVHSHIDHLYALIEAARRAGVKPLLHMITDGRDTAPKSALDGLVELERRLRDAGGAIASLCGRFYAMDRDQRWERTELAWRALILGKGQSALTAETAIRAAYKAGDTDEFIQPVLLPTFEKIREQDAVICFNFRKDRPRQLVASLSKHDFTGFDRGTAERPEVSCMMPYSRADRLPYLFESERPATTLGQVISSMGLSQFHCAETEKYAHVTYFFNGGRAEPYSGEKQLLIPSPRVATYDLKPQMSAVEVADAVIQAIASGRYSFMVVNFANGDMVGHTAKRHAVLAAVKSLDNEVGRVLESAEKADYSVVLTADHGNCEEMVNPMTGEPHTQHTTYPVPCMVMDENNWVLSCQSGLSSIAPTVLQLMGIHKPACMTAESILLKSLPRKRCSVREEESRIEGAA